MVVALEPFLTHWHCQDLFLITEDKPELLLCGLPPTAWPYAVSN